MKKAHLITYVDKMQLGDSLCLAIVGQCLHEAHNDRVTDLIVTKNEYDTIRRWMAYGSMWNWDMKTFWGMNIIVQES